MENSSKIETRFYATLSSALVDCLPDAPNRQIFCPISTAYGIVTGLLLPLVAVSGLFGNCVTAWITLGRGAERSRLNVYLGAMAIADSAYLLVSGCLGLFLARGLPWISGGRLGFIVQNTSGTVCTAYKFAVKWLGLQSMGIFLAMVLDRALCLAMPFRFQVVSVRTAWRICGAVVVASLALSSVCLVIYGWVEFHFAPIAPRMIVCMVNTEIGGLANAVLGVYMTLFLHPPTVPIFCILVTNCYLVCKLVVILRRRRQLTTSADEKDKMANTIVCVALSVLLTLCSLPSVLTIISGQIVGENRTEADAQLLRALLNTSKVSEVLIMFNQSGNWLLLLWKSPRYRLRFVALFGFQRRELRRSSTGPNDHLPTSNQANSQNRF